MESTPATREINVENERSVEQLWGDKNIHGRFRFWALLNILTTAITRFGFLISLCLQYLQFMCNQLALFYNIPVVGTSSFIAYNCETNPTYISNLVGNKYEAVVCFIFNLYDRYIQI